MSGDQGSGYEWRRKRGWVNRALGRVEDLPWKALSFGGTLTDSAKRKLYEEGIPGQAQILKAPGDHSISEVQENIGRFRARVELPGRDPYEVWITQSFGGGNEAEGLKEGALVECRVDPKKDKRVLLIAPEPEGRRVTGVVDSSDILAKGKRATAKVESASKLDVRAPCSGDPIYELVMELRSEEEPYPWRIRIGQRVPAGAEDLVKRGAALTVAYLVVDDGDSAAVDWPASTGGRFS